MASRQRRSGRAKIAMAAIASVGFASSTHAAILNFEMRALTGSPSTARNNYNNQVRVVNPFSIFIGSVVTLDLWALLSLGDTNAVVNDEDQGPGSNDGLHYVEGSFRSFVDQLKGDLSVPSTASNRGVLTGLVENGAVQDVDGDNDLDVGNITYTGNPNLAPNASAWFFAASGLYPRRGAGGSREIITATQMIEPIARLTFTVTFGFADTAGAINFVPRLVVNNNSSSERRIGFLVDDVEYQVDANGNGTATGYFDTNDTTISGGTLGTNTINVSGVLGVGPPVILAPEPSGLSLLGISTFALLRRSRQNLSRQRWR